MHDSADAIYCSQQILVPPRFPHILKAFAKDAIRTQPFDLLRWSAAYFRCLAEGVPAPCKSRIEVPPTVAMCGLTPGYLRVLLKQFGMEDRIKRSDLYNRWLGLCLCEIELKKMLTLGRMIRGENVPWLEFFAIAVGYLNKSLTHTMIMLCELLTCEPDGGSAAIPMRLFERLYRFLASMDCSKPRKYFGGRKIDDAGRFEEREEDWSIDGGAEASEAEKSEAVREVSEMMAEMQQQQQSALPDALFYAPTSGADGAGFDDPGGCGGDMVTVAVCDEEVQEKKSSSDLKIVESIEIMQLTHGNSDLEIDFTPIMAVSEPGGIVDETAAKRRDDGKHLAEKDGKLRRATVEKEEIEMAEIRTELLRISDTEIDEEMAGDEEDEEGSEVSVTEMDLAAKTFNVESDAEAPVTTDDEREEFEAGDIGEAEAAIEQEKDEMVLPEEAEIAQMEPLPHSPGSSVQYNQDTERMMFGEDFQPGSSDLMYCQVQELADIPCSCYGESGGAESVASVSEAPQEQPLSEPEPAPCPGTAVRDYRKKLMETPSMETLQVPAIPGIGPAVPLEMQDELLNHLAMVSRKQHGMVMPRNLRHYLCPPLEPDDVVIPGSEPPPQTEIAIIGLSSYAEGNV